MARQLNPLHAEIFQRYRVDYYWSTHQSEFATDVTFQREEDLRRLFPRLIRHAISTFGSPDVLRFLGRKIAAGSPVPDQYSEEVFSDVKRRQEGVRIKHHMGGNSIKAYDKAYTEWGSLFRVETTINREEQFWVYRPKEGDCGGDKDWRKMRRGIADFYRRAEVGQKANHRYLDALASVDDSRSLEELVGDLERPTRWKQKRVRALHLFGQDAALLEAVSRGEFTINGMRNRDLQGLLYPAQPICLAEARRRSSAVSRKLRLLRAHGLIQKVPHTHRYVLTPSGRQAITALLAARQASVTRLTQTAA